MKKVCCACKIEKDVTEFYRSNARYYQRECKECNRIRKHKWHQTEQGKLSSANTKLKQRFGITLAEYNGMLNKINRRCEICGCEFSDHGHRLAVDHDHTTGKIRGLLCKSCNVGIARFKDNPKILLNAIEYVSRF